MSCPIFSEHVSSEPEHVPNLNAHEIFETFTSSGPSLLPELALLMF